MMHSECVYTNKDDVRAVGWLQAVDEMREAIGKDEIGAAEWVHSLQLENLQDEQVRWCAPIKVDGRHYTRTQAQTRVDAWIKHLCTYFMEHIHA
jgi:hypothetical protein